LLIVIIFVSRLLWLVDAPYHNQAEPRTFSLPQVAVPKIVFLIEQKDAAYVWV